MTARSESAIITTALTIADPPVNWPGKLASGLVDFRKSLMDLLGQQLRALYVYGSLASGCHNGRTSDVDVLVVLAEPIGDELKAALLEKHKAVVIPIDATYITEAELNQDVFPTPLQCVIRPVKLFRVPNGLVDFPVIRQDVYANGVRLLGPAVRELINPVPWDVLRPCVMQLLPVALERFKNPVLMLCRIVCTMHTHEPCSKAQAARWALEHFDAAWHGVITEALAGYEEGRKASGLPAQQSADLEAYCKHLASPA